MDKQNQAAVLTAQLTPLLLPLVYGVNIAVVLTALYGVMIHLTTFAHPELSEDEAAERIRNLINLNRAPEGRA